MKTPIERLEFWINTFASEESLFGRGNDEYWDITFRGSDLWNLRHAFEAVKSEVDAPFKYTKIFSSHEEMQKWLLRQVDV